MHVVKGTIYANGVETSTPREMERAILSSLSRLVAAECMPHFMGGELRLFDTKGNGYRSIGQRVVVSYEEQDSCGFFHQVDYIGRVVSVDPLDGLLVNSTGDDSDEWAWGMGCVCTGDIYHILCMLTQLHPLL